MPALRSKRIDPSLQLSVAYEKIYICLSIELFSLFFRTVACITIVGAVMSLDSFAVFSQLLDIFDNLLEFSAVRFVISKGL